MARFLPYRSYLLVAITGRGVSTMIRLKRAYEPASDDDGARYLIDRLWPRGIKKEDLRIDGWLKEIAPSTELRKWFGHDPAKWVEFQQRYRRELEDNAAAWQPLLDAARQGTLTLVYSAKDTEHNDAVVLHALLEERLGQH
ncbi:MAG TPA: DUF488 domain-containing protein [Thermomicrobiales bacterium]|nr:DUF488 domain-containing protein [Thermomicrobiales bacterium]HQZ90442.1 DUF488 domain-containing protein [Thermomicrobiales bacterium]